MSSISKYAAMTLPRMQQVWDKLGGDEGVKKFLAGETNVVSMEDHFPPWNVVMLGTHKSASELKLALLESGCDASDAEALLDHPDFVFSAAPARMYLARASVGSLGFRDGATYKEICDRASLFGLRLCPAEVGPALRLHYVEQPEGEWLDIAMEPLKDKEGFFHVFAVMKHSGMMRLQAHNGAPDHRCGPTMCFVFYKGMV